jgi:hypothetical protein
VRLAAFCLSGALALSAQTPALPWRAAPALPWQMEQPGPAPAPVAAPPVQTAFTLTVRVAADGAVRVTDENDLAAPLRFSPVSPLQRGIGGMPVGAPDFRPALEGLLWILDDDETILTVLHPATSQVVYLPLPGGQDMSMVFRPDRLEAVEGGAKGSAWSLHWLALLPQFIQLGKDASAGKARGTALQPFPKE